jgi:hypothetical protein
VADALELGRTLARDSAFGTPIALKRREARFLGRQSATIFLNSLAFSPSARKSVSMYHGAAHHQANLTEDERRAAEMAITPVASNVNGAIAFDEGPFSGKPACQLCVYTYANVLGVK